MKFHISNYKLQILINSLAFQVIDLVIYNTRIYFNVYNFVILSSLTFRRFFSSTIKISEFELNG